MVLLQQLRRAWYALSLLTPLCLALSAHAQVSLYGTVAFTHPSGVPTGSADNMAQQAAFTTTGIGAGLTVNFLPIPIVSLGMDLRGSTRQGTQGTDTILAGLKAGARVPIIHLKPYVEGAAGYLGTRTADAGNSSRTIDNHYAVYEVLGGIDLPWVKFVDFRLIEIGAGSSFGSSPNPSFYTVNSGLVVHF